MRVMVEMPFVGESIEQLRIRAWHRQIGDHVKQDEPLVEVTTEKIDFTIDAPATGTLVEVRANVDDAVAPNALVAVIETSD